MKNHKFGSIGEIKSRFFPNDELGNTLEDGEFGTELAIKSLERIKSKISKL